MRIKGLVRARRTAVARLERGIPVEEREAYQAGIRSVLGQAEALLASEGACASDLPAPSRNALRDLAGIAARDPASLPEPDGSRPPPAAPRRVGVRNVVRTRNLVLEALGRATSPDGVPTIAIEEAELCSDAVQRILDGEDADASALAPQARLAFLLLRWLARKGNAARYVQGIVQARNAFRRILESGRTPYGADRPAIDVVFQPGRTAWRVRRLKQCVEARLSVGFLAADEDVLEDIAGRTLLVDPESRSRQADAPRFLDDDAFLDLKEEIVPRKEAPPHAAQGRVRNLRTIFDQLNERYFEGTLSRPRLGWERDAAPHRFGSYHARRDEILITERLDDAAVPGFVVEFVLYHEMLHKALPMERHGDRRIVHTNALRQRECAFEHHAEAELWLQRLARGAAPPPPDEPPRKVPRNAPCPCGSGRKYKKCCGRGG